MFVSSVLNLVLELSDLGYFRVTWPISFIRSNLSEMISYDRGEFVEHDEMRWDETNVSVVSRSLYLKKLSINKVFVLSSTLIWR